MKGMERCQDKTVDEGDCEDGGKGRTANGDDMDHQGTVGIRCDNEECDKKMIRCYVWQLLTLIDEEED